MRIRLPRRATPLSAVVGLALVVSACGAGTVTEGSAAPLAASDSTAVGGDETANGAEPAESTENLFPTVDVVRVSDGSTLNLAAALGGGDLPVLLWFWAPH